MTTGQGIDAYRVSFSGTGGEYFRVWIVNLLLTILTLSLYTPWARRRTARYFYDHTMVADSPLEFAGPLRKMVFGFIVFALLYVAFEIASRTGQETAVRGFIIAAAVLAPYVWGSAMRFRLSSTRWRGLQLRFSASWKDVYFASWPVFAMAAIWLGVTFGLETLSANDGPASAAPGRPAPFFFRVTAAQWALVGLGVLLSVLCIIRTEFNYKSLLVLRGGIGQQDGRWKPAYGDFVRVWLATLGVFLAGVALLVAAVVAVSLAVQSGVGNMPRSNKFMMVVIGFVIGLTVIIGLVIASAPARAYREARMFQLIWSNVGLSQVARFKSQLRPWAYVRLRMKNLLLTLLTLGLYRPFARVSEYRMKTDSVTLYVKGSLDQLVGQLEKQQGGLGDALADVAGLDLIG